MQRSRLDIAAELVLAGILREVPDISCMQLDELLARVSRIHWVRFDKATIEEAEHHAGKLVDRMHSHAIAIRPELARRKRKPLVRRNAHAKLGNKWKSRRNAAGELVCIVCDTPIEAHRVPPAGRYGGRMPVFCLNHQKPSSRTHFIPGEGAS